MASKDQPSTLKSYVDSASATVQSAVGSITGNPTDKVEAEKRKEAAAQEHAASHTAAKVGPVNMSSTGEATIDNQDRRDGQWNETVGSTKKAIGNLIGNQSLKNEGARQEQEGQGQKAAGQLKDLGSGTADRVTGTIGSGLSSLAGNSDAQAEFKRQHDQGKTTVRGVQAEVNSEDQ